MDYAAIESYANSVAPAIGGDRLAAELEEYLGRFIKTSEDNLLIYALWIMHCYAYETIGVTPRLVISSPTGGAGKSTLLELINSLTPNPAKVLPSTTNAVIRDFLPEDRCPLVYDEFDRPPTGDRTELLHDGYREQELANTYNARNESGGHDKEEYSPFRPAVIAGIRVEQLSYMLPQTLERCIVTHITKAPKGDVQKYKWRTQGKETAKLKEKLRAWGESAHTPLATIVSNLEDEDAESILGFEAPEARFDEIWESLAIVATTQSGDTLERVREIAKEYAERLTEDDGDEDPASSTREHRLIRDCKIAFDKAADERGGNEQNAIATQVLIEYLQAINPEEWKYGYGGGKGLTWKGLSSLLIVHGIKSDRPGGAGGESRAKRYQRQSFVAKWRELGLLAEDEEPTP